MAVGPELRGKQQKTIDEKIVKALRDKINIAGRSFRRRCKTMAYLGPNKEPIPCCCRWLIRGATTSVGNNAE